MMKRRDLIKGLTLLPLGGAVGSMLPFKEACAEPSAKAADLFGELGIEPLINARGTVTFLSGSLMLPEVVEAIRATSRDFANLHEVIDKVGAKIAEMLHTEGALVTSGAAGALTLGTAACITGTDKDKIAMLPQLPGPQSEVVIQKSHRYVFDHAVRMTGAKMVEVESAEEMDRAFNDHTVMALFFNAASDWYGIPDTISHEQFIELAKKHRVPTFIDAAADVPPAENLFRFQKMGFDLVTFSGGKMLRGPQSTGLLIGRGDLIEAAKLNFDPYECPIGRPMKVNKEEIIGMYVALKSFLARDHKKEWQDWIDRTKRITTVVETVPTVKGQTEIHEGASNHFPGLVIRWDQKRIRITPDQVVEALQKGKPRIEASGGKEALGIAVVTLRPDQVDIVARRVKEVLENAG